MGEEDVVGEEGRGKKQETRGKRGKREGRVGVFRWA